MRSSHPGGTQPSITRRCHAQAGSPLSKRGVSEMLGVRFVPWTCLRDQRQPGGHPVVEQAGVLGDAQRGRVGGAAH